MENSDGYFNSYSSVCNLKSEKSPITEFKRDQNIEATKQEVIISRGKMAALKILRDGHIKK